MIPERFRTIWDTRTFSTPCATRRWRRTDLKLSGRIKCSAGSGVGSEILRKPKCKNHRNNACKVTRQCFLEGRLPLVPELLDRLRMQAVAALVEDNPADFPILKVVVEGFEPGHFLPYSLWYPSGARPGRDLDIGGQQPEHALLAEATQEGPHRIRVRMRLLRALGGCAFCHQHERADQFVAPLDLVHKRELELRKIPR